MMVIVICITFWVICGVLAYGILLGHAVGEYPEQRYRRGDIGMAAYFGFLGPIGLLAALFCSGFIQYGFRWR